MIGYERAHVHALYMYSVHPSTVNGNRGQITQHAVWQAPQMAHQMLIGQARGSHAIALAAGAATVVVPCQHTCMRPSCSLRGWCRGAAQRNLTGHIPLRGPRTQTPQQGPDGSVPRAAAWLDPRSLRLTLGPCPLRTFTRLPCWPSVPYGWTTRCVRLST